MLLADMCDSSAHVSDSYLYPTSVDPSIKRPLPACRRPHRGLLNMTTGSLVIHELLWSVFLLLLLPVELRGLMGAATGTGQGRVLLPWLLKPEVAVEEGEKPPLTRAERKHSAAHIKRPAQLEQSTSSMTF